MEQEFSRKAMAGIWITILALLTIVGGFRHGINNFIPQVVYFIGGGVKQGYAVWGFIVPYIAINDNSIIIKQSPFGTEEIKIKDISNIVFLEEEISINQKSENTTIRLNLLGEEDRENLATFLKKVKP